MMYLRSIENICSVNHNKWLIHDKHLRCGYSKYVYFHLQYMAVYTVHVLIFCLAANVVREDLLDDIVFISWYPLLVPGQPH